jgi:DNA-formamidopyrimidine glycosylase
MPEGPEIHRYAGILADYFHDNSILDIRVLSGRYMKKPITNLEKIRYPLMVKDIGTKGKFLFMELSDGHYLFITHGMSGTWNHDQLYEETRYDHFDAKHNRIEFVSRKGSIYFNDYRNFGTFQVIDNKEQLDRKLNELGYDILDDTITEERFFERISRKKDKKIGMLLMDQKLVSGIGNYLRAEILWYSRVSPHRLYQSLTREEKTRLFNAAYNLSRYYTIKKKSQLFPSMATTKLEYHLNITPTDDFFVYQQDIDHYGNPVVSEKMGDRTIHWVPKIQK